jgi:hypothetical protein
MRTFEENRNRKEKRREELSEGGRGGRDFSENLLRVRNFTFKNLSLIEPLLWPCIWLGS